MLDMAHDGQDMLRADTALLTDLLSLTAIVVPAVETVFDAARARVKDRKSVV